MQHTVTQTMRICKLYRTLHTCTENSMHVGGGGHHCYNV